MEIKETYIVELQSSPFRGRRGFYLSSNRCLLALRAGNQAAKKAMVVAVTATSKKSLAISFTGK